MIIHNFWLPLFISFSFRSYRGAVLAGADLEVRVYKNIITF